MGGKGAEYLPPCLISERAHRAEHESIAYYIAAVNIDVLWQV